MHNTVTPHNHAPRSAEHTSYNPDKFIILFKDGGLYECHLIDAKEVRENLAWQKRGGHDASQFLVLNYDYMQEVFFDPNNNDVEIGFKDVSRGCLKEHVLTRFRAEFFPSETTRILKGAGHE